MASAPTSNFCIVGFFPTAASHFSRSFLHQISPNSLLACRPFRGTMANIGLADDEIDRLLAEAEVRLAGAGSADAVAVVPASTALATVAAPAAANAGDQTAVSDKKPEKLTVRVPQLAQKQKVCVFSLSSFSLHMFHDEDLSQIKMTLATSRHGYRAGTTMISYNHSYSDRTPLPHSFCTLQFGRRSVLT